MGALLEGQRHKTRAGGIQVFVDAAFRMDPVKPANDITVHHVNNGFGHRVIDSFIGLNALLDDDLVDLLAVFDDAHFVAGLL